MEVTVDITREDYWRFNKHYLWRKIRLRKHRKLLGLALLLVLFLAGALTLLRRDLGWLSEMAASPVGALR